tara:strand:+ start:156 stop:740 length:585 start_codon:yes stop_codon:yes gene_type:complete
MSKVQPVFPTPVYDNKIRGSVFDKVQEEIGDSLSKVDFRFNDSFGDTHFLSDPTFQENYIEKHSLDSLSSVIKQNVENYMINIGNTTEIKYRIASSWIALFKPGHYGHLHDHGITDISGVYYYKTNGKDGNIFFESPNNNLVSSIPFNHLSHSVTYDPQEGVLLLFPGWLKHGINKNKTDETRISLSFNIYFDK